MGFRKFSINYGFGSISSFNTPELIEMLLVFTGDVALLINF